MHAMSHVRWRHSCHCPLLSTSVSPSSRQCRWKHPLANTRVSTCQCAAVADAEGTALTLPPVRSGLQQDAGPVEALVAYKPTHPDVKLQRAKAATHFDDEAASPIDVYSELGTSILGNKKGSVMKSFNTARPLSHLLASNMQALGMQKPTIVQQYAIPCIQAGKNIMVVSPPGTGKTAAFLVPVLNQLMKTTRPRTKNFGYPAALVLCTSWEHCMQIQEACKQLVKGSHLKVLALHGGVPIVDQILKLRGGCDVVVATAGRLLDHLDKGRVRLANLKVLVLDNVELLLSPSCQTDLRRILHSRTMPPHAARQTLAFSSMLTAAQQLVLRDLMQYPVELQVGIPLTLPPNITHKLCQVEVPDKMPQLLRDLGSSKALSIVFCNTRSMVEEVFDFLQDHGIKCCSIHKDHTQLERENSWQSFKYHVNPVLVTTSIAARGMDVPDVDLVVNFDLPSSNVGEYICRVGRTGRGGRPGVAVAYVGARERLAPRLREMLLAMVQEVPSWLEEQVEMQAKAKQARRNSRVAEPDEQPLRRVGPNPPAFGGYTISETHATTGASNYGGAEAQDEALEASRAEPHDTLSHAAASIDAGAESPEVEVTASAASSPVAVRQEGVAAGATAEDRAVPGPAAAAASESPDAGQAGGVSGVSGMGAASGLRSVDQASPAAGCAGPEGSPEGSHEGSHDGSVSAPFGQAEGEGEARGGVAEVGSNSSYAARVVVRENQTKFSRRTLQQWKQLAQAGAVGWPYRRRGPASRRPLPQVLVGTDGEDSDLRH